MPAFNFKPQFVAPIRAGTKCHTIRGERKDGKPPAKVGDQMALYCGMRRKGCFKILPGKVTCTKVEAITIRITPPCVYEIAIEGEPLDLTEAMRLAVADGFSTLDEMMAFWDGRLPFRGYIIHWRSM